MWQAFCPAKRCARRVCANRGSARAPAARDPPSEPRSLEPGEANPGDRACPPQPRASVLATQLQPVERAAVAVIPAQEANPAGRFRRGGRSSQGAWIRWCKPRVLVWMQRRSGAVRLRPGHAPLGLSACDLRTNSGPGVQTTGGPMEHPGGGRQSIDFCGSVERTKESVGGAWVLTRPRP